MSYILDALQRADAERERGQVPGLHSRSAPLAGDPRASRPVRWWLPAAVMVLAGLLLLSWWLFWPSTAPSPAPGAVLAPAPAVPAPAPLQAGSGAAAAGDSPASGPSLPILSAVPQAAAPAGPTRQATEVQAAARAGGTAQPPAASPTPATAPPPPAAAAPPPAQEARLPSFGELSADVRARLPQLSVSGATYSANPAHRMLIVNGQVLQEGQEIQSGLRLESIGPRSATLDHQGLRYTIGY